MGEEALGSNQTSIWLRRILSVRWQIGGGIWAINPAATIWHGKNPAISRPCEICRRPDKKFQLSGLTANFGGFMVRPMVGAYRPWPYRRRP